MPCLLTRTLLLNTGHCVKRVWVSLKGSNNVVNVFGENDVILCTEAVFLQENNQESLPFNMKAFQ